MRARESIRPSTYSIPESLPYFCGKSKIIIKMKAQSCTELGRLNQTAQSYTGILLKPIYVWPDAFVYSPDSVSISIVIL